MLLHLLKRDLRHTRWYLVAMLLTLGALCALPTVAFERLGDIRANSNLMNTYVLLVVAHVGATLALVRRLVAEDAPLHETAFWRTRPLAPGVVLGAKVIYATLFIVVLPTLVSLPAGVGLDAGNWTRGAWQVANVQGMLALFGLAVAMLSRRMLVGLAVVIGGYVLFAASSLQTLMDQAANRSQLESYFGHARSASRNLVALTLVGAAIGWAVWRAYRRAEQRRGLIAVAGAFVAAFAVMLGWPWTVLPASWTAPGAAASAVRAGAEKSLRLELLNAGTNTTPGTVWGNLRRDAEGDTFWRLKRIEVSLRGANGEVQTVFPALHSAGDLMGNGPRELTSPTKDGYDRLGGARPTFPVWFPELTKERPADASVRVSIEEGALRTRAVDARAGAREGARGDELRVVEVALNPDEVEIAVVDTYPARVSKAIFRQTRYVLVNPKKGTAVSWSTRRAERILDGFYRKAAAARLPFPRGEFGELSDAELREWLAGARLVRATYEPVDEFAVELGPVALPPAR